LLLILTAIVVAGGTEGTVVTAGRGTSTIVALWAVTILAILIGFAHLHAVEALIPGGSYSGGRMNKLSILRRGSGMTVSHYSPHWYNLGPSRTFRMGCSTRRPCSTTSTASSGEALNPPSSSSSGYNHLEVEKKWQDYWERHEVFKAVRRAGHPKKKYVLDMFPYPSGAGLHVGHPEGTEDIRLWLFIHVSELLIAARVHCDRHLNKILENERLRRPTSDGVSKIAGSTKKNNAIDDAYVTIRWDAFGLPAEQHAIQTGTHPAVTTKKNIETFKRQLKSLGFSYDWSRELSTTDPEYVRWTQWIFLQIFKAGLAKQDEVSVNWCPKLGGYCAE
jgi:hypothetical protein